MPNLDRLERVTDLLLVLLDTSRPLSLREIADRVPGYPEGHGARRQAFERDKRLLRDEGVPVLVEPVEGDDQVGYRVDPGAYYLPDLALEADEQAALNLAVAGVHVGEPIGRDALSKLGAGGAAMAGRRPASLVDLASIQSLPALPVLFDAARRHATVTFPYRGDPRTVAVGGIRFRRGHWYVVGHDHDRDDVRTFRVDRIEGLPEAVDRPAPDPVHVEVDVEAAVGRDPWAFGEGDEVVVTVAVDAAEAGRVVAELGPDVDHDRRPDGSVEVRLAVTDVEALVTWVLDLLDHAEVVGPPAVRSAVVTRLEALVAAGPDGEPGR